MVTNRSRGVRKERKETVALQLLVRLLFLAFVFRAHPLVSLVPYAPCHLDQFLAVSRSDPFRGRPLAACITTLIRSGIVHSSFKSFPPTRAEEERKEQKGFPLNHGWRERSGKKWHQNITSPDCFLWSSSSLFRVVLTMIGASGNCSQSFSGQLIPDEIEGELRGLIGGHLHRIMTCHTERQRSDC